MSVEPSDPADGSSGEGRRFSALIGSLAAVTSRDRGSRGAPGGPGDQGGQGDPGGPGDRGGQDDPGSQSDPGGDETGSQEAPVTRPTFTARPGGSAAAGAPEPADAPDAGAPVRSQVPAPEAVPTPRSPAGPQAVSGGEATRPLPATAATATDEPLLGDADRLRARWQGVQAGFVDDPGQAVGGAADLIEQTAQALIGALRQRQRELRVMWESGPGAGAEDGESAGRASETEHLRLMMQRYRALFNQLCRP